MLITDFELRRNLTEAFKCGRYMITITRVAKDEKSKKKKKFKLEHYFKTVQFPREDIDHTLEELAELLGEEANVQKNNS